MVHKTQHYERHGACIQSQFSILEPKTFLSFIAALRMAATACLSADSGVLNNNYITFTNIQRMK